MNIATPNSGVQDQPIIIVRKVKKRGHAAHHGGAWKVAYADFVTAMMAFFLLLWLLNATTQEQRRAISNYFAPEAISRSMSGAGGVLGGQKLTEKSGAAASSGMGIMVPVPAPPEKEETEEEKAALLLDEKDKAAKDSEDAGGEKNAEDSAQAAEQTGSATEEARVPGGVDEATFEAARQRLEEKRFDQAEKDILEAVERIPMLQGLSDSLLIDRTDEGLRIQMVDQDQIAMFPRGSTVVPPHTRELLKRMAVVLRRLPNRIAVTGHTDAAPYANPDGYSNWELSTDRANASRRSLIAAGIAKDRFARVVGKADKELLLPGDPLNSRNRRISIVVLSDYAENQDKAKIKRKE